MPKKKPEPVVTLPELKVAERTGIGKSGGRFHIKVAVAGIKVNGQEVSSELAADVLAGLLAQGVEETNVADTR